MMRFLSKLMRKSQTANTARTRRRAVLQLEGLEGRMLLSAAPVALHAAPLTAVVQQPHEQTTIKVVYQLPPSVATVKIVPGGPNSPGSATVHHILGNPGAAGTTSTVNHSAGYPAAGGTTVTVYHHPGNPVIPVPGDPGGGGVSGSGGGIGVGGGGGDGGGSGDGPSVPGGIEPGDGGGNQGGGDDHFDRTDISTQLD